MAHQITSVILAAGKGTRMNLPHQHKVCCTVAGVPVIVRSLKAYHAAGITSHLLVVGQHAEQVMASSAVVDTTVMFCYQAEQKGTGHATKIAARVLESQGYDGDVMIIAGDKVLEAGILDRLLATFYGQACDLALAVGAVDDFPGSGRIITDADGAIIGNVEVFDIARMQYLIRLRNLTQQGPVPATEAERLGLEFFSRENKAAKALGPVWQAIKAGQSVDRALLETHFTETDYQLSIHGKSYPPALLENVKYVNISIYLFKAKALYHALKQLGSDNAQNEEYLTDTIAILAAEGAKVAMVPLRYAEEAMTYNTPEELEAIERYYSAKAGA